MCGRRKKGLVKSRIRSIFGFFKRIHARETQVHRVNIKETNQFLETHHLNVPTQAKYKFGIFLHKELVSVATFSGKRTFTREGKQSKSFEMIRFCSKHGTNVIGGMSKLISNFKKEVTADEVMTYADRDWSSGRSYKKLGFEMTEEMHPTPFWINVQSMERWHESRFLKQLNGASAPNHFVKIWNAGSLKFVKRFE